MALSLWYEFKDHINDINYLKDLVKQVSFIQLHINLTTLKLCIKRNNLGIPKEIWNIICGFIVKDIKNLKQKEPYFYNCPLDKTYLSKRHLDVYPPKHCDCHNLPITYVTRYDAEDMSYKKV